MADVLTQMTFFNGWVTSSPTYGVADLSQALCVLAKIKRPAFWKHEKHMLFANVRQQLMCLPICENIKQTRDAIPCGQFA